MAATSETSSEDLVYARYEVYRKQGAVSWDEAEGVWQVVGYPECAYVFQHEELFAHPYRRDLIASEQAYAGTAEVMGGRRAVLMLHGEEHRALHHYVLRSIHKSAERYRTERIRPLVDELIDRFACRGRVDFTGEFADLLPGRSIAAILGLPWQDETLLMQCKRWNDDIARWSESFGGDPEAMRVGRAAAHGLDEVLRPIVRNRQEAPQGDYISELWREGPKILDNWDEDDVLAQCRLLFFAGSESTSHFLSNMGHVLCRQPELQADLRSHPEAVPVFVEETLRAVAAVQFRMRIAVQDCELNGNRIRVGDRIYAINAAANRDPNRYSHPDRIDLSRRNPHGHMAFNVGPRTCPGAPLARVEGQEAASAIVRRLRGLSLDVHAESPAFSGSMLSSYRPLSMLFERESAATLSQEGTA